jgi:hypothetical protein
VQVSNSQLLPDGFRLMHVPIDACRLPDIMLLTRVFQGLEYCICSGSLAVN